jgi:hypothetical protein
VVKGAKTAVKNAPRPSVLTNKNCEVCNSRLPSDGVYAAIVIRYVGEKCNKGFIYFCKPHQPAVAVGTSGPKR